MDKNKIKKLKLYGEKGNFKGFIAEIYAKDNKVVVESKDKTVEEILEKEINKAIKEKNGLWVPTGGNVAKVSIDNIIIQFHQESARQMETKIIEDKSGKAKNLLEKILEKINKIQKSYPDILKKVMKEKKHILNSFDYTIDETIRQLEAEGYKIVRIGGEHYIGSKFIGINDSNFLEEVMKGICFAQWEDNSGNYHPALAKRLRDIGYKISYWDSIKKSIITEE